MNYCGIRAVDFVVIVISLLQIATGVVLLSIDNLNCDPQLYDCAILNAQVLITYPLQASYYMAAGGLTILLSLTSMALTCSVKTARNINAGMMNAAISVSLQFAVLVYSSINATVSLYTYYETDVVVLFRIGLQANFYVVMWMMLATALSTLFLGFPLLMYQLGQRWQEWRLEYVLRMRPDWAYKQPMII